MIQCGVRIPASHLKVKLKKIGRNDPCYCGSGVKNKKCETTHMAKIREMEAAEVERWQRFQAQNPNAVPGLPIIRMMERLDIACKCPETLPISSLFPYVSDIVGFAMNGELR